MCVYISIYIFIDGCSAAVENSGTLVAARGVARGKHSWRYLQSQTDKPLQSKQVFLTSMPAVRTAEGSATCALQTSNPRSAKLQRNPKAKNCTWKLHTLTVQNPLLSRAPVDFERALVEEGLNTTRGHIRPSKTG